MGSGSGINLQPELVADVVNDAVRHVDRKISEHKLKCIFSDELLMAKMDSRLIEQVIINIVNNAVKYTPVGSEITISSFRDGDTAKIKIADDGSGIPERSQANLFDMFYTEDNKTGDSRRGLGLGLYLCRSISEAHGGKICVSNNEPHGAVFELSLPISEVTHCE